MSGNGITRRTALGAFAAAATLRGDVRYPEYSRCLPDYLANRARWAYQKRNEAIAKLTTPAAIRERQKWVRDTFWRLVGGMPHRTSLNVRNLGAFDRSGYNVEKLVYESQPGLFIPANLYIPTTGKPPYPGVLFQMGHTRNGKAGDTYQKCCQGLARLGYVVLAFDPMGQGERVYYPTEGGNASRLASPDEEHTVPGRQMLLIGETASRMQVWDAIRSLDVLASHPLVDPKRLASTGQSGGGTLTMMLCAVDERLTTSCVSSGNTENFACAGFNPPGSTDDAEQDFVGSGSLGFDRFDLMYPLAPKPLLITVSAHDAQGTYSPTYLSSSREEFGKLKRVYEVLNSGDRLAWGETSLPHGLTYSLRLQIYNWFEKWLKGSTRVIEVEPETNVERDETLWVGKTGNVIRDFGSTTPLEMMRRKASTFSPRVLTSLEIRALASPRNMAGTPLNALSRVASEGYSVTAIEVQSAVAVPSWLFLPPKPDTSKPLIILLEPPGRNAHWREGDLCSQLAREGFAVCATDVRGIGDMTPEYGRGNPHYVGPHESMEDYAWAGLILGNPLPNKLDESKGGLRMTLPDLGLFNTTLLSQRVTDLLTLVDSLRLYAPIRSRRIVLAARNHLTVPALFTAAIDPNISTAYLATALVSYRSILDTEQYMVPLGNFLPGILKQTDLPQIAGSCAPRKVIVAGAVDAWGQKVPMEKLRESYGQNHIELRDEPAWNVEAFRSL